MDYWKDLADELTFVLNCAVLAAETLGRDHPASADLEQVRRSAMRCAAIAHDALIPLPPRP
jgi:hypothetical protein